MLKFFYRLKKRGGVVLFAVIAFMTLLITMATVAYFSARAAFNTVISNYDFSQMYISTTSVSDMIIAALAEDTSKAGADATKGLNYFDGLKSKVEKMINDTGGDPTKAGATLVGVSNNIAYADKDNVSKILVDGANNAVEPGVIDAVKTSIKLESIVQNSPSTGINTYYFSITTVGYYRNNTITVQDFIYATAGSKSPKSNNLFSTFFTATGQKLTDGGVDESGRTVIINTQEISDNAYFQNRFTMFVKSDANNTFRGGLKTTGGLYINHMNSMTVDAPTATDRHDWIIGGDFYLGGNGQIKLNGNDLYVHGDLYLANAQAIEAGNVYVEGNVYLCMSGSGGFSLSGGTERLNNLDKDGNLIKDKDGNTPFAKNGLYVNGDVIKVTDTSTVKTGSSSWSEGKAAIAKLAGVAQEDLTIKAEFDALNKLVSDAGITDSMSFPCSVSAPGVSGGTFYQNSGKTHDCLPAGKSFTWGDLEAEIAEQVENSTSYDMEINKTSVDSLLDPESGMTRIEYDNYSANATTYNNVLTLDFSKVTGGEITLDSPITLGTVGGQNATITYKDNKEWKYAQNVVLDLPYVKGGYLLQYVNMPVATTGYTDPKDNSYKTVEGGVFPCDIYGNGTLTVRIKTPNEPQKDEEGKIIYMTTTDEEGKEVIAKDEKGDPIPVPETMPIVLAANFDDGSGTATDAQGYNAFRWTASQRASNGGVVVELVDKDADPGTYSTYTTNDAGQKVYAASATGNVVLEMGTYNTDGKKEDRKYQAYDPDKLSTLDCPTYYTHQGEKVGTLNQVSNISTMQPSNPSSADQYKFLKSGSNDCKEDFDNKIILVSNKNQCNVAFNAQALESTFCGYIYAPNGVYDGWQKGSNMPIFGGMIVTDYRVKLGSYLYGQPDPGLIAALGNTLKSKNKHSHTSDVVETTWETHVGKNYLG